MVADCRRLTTYLLVCMLLSAQTCVLRPLGRHPPPRPPSHAASRDASMANIDTLDPSENISKEAGVGEVQDGTVAEGPAKKGADEVAVVSKPSSPAKDATPALPSPGPSLVPLRSSSTNGLSSSTSGTPTLSMPHPKKFSHSDINKRFLEKNSPSSSGSQASSTPSISKPGTAVRT